MNAASGEPGREVPHVMELDPRIQVPSRIARLPRHKGLPVPAMVQFDANGVPDFRVIDMERWIKLARGRGCGICGAGLGTRMWFVGGPKAIENRLFCDLPMHHDCARFALRVCPFLALPRFRMTMAKVELEGVVIDVNEHVDTKRPERFGLARTSSYLVVKLAHGPGMPMLQPERFAEIEWWQEGRRVA